MKPYQPKEGKKGLLMQNLAQVNKEQKCWVGVRAWNICRDPSIKQNTFGNWPR